MGAEQRAHPAHPAALALWVLVLALPVIVTPGAFHSHVTGRWLLFGVVVLTAMVLGTRRAWRQVPLVVQGAWLLFVATAALAATSAQVPLDALIGDSARRVGLLTIAALPGAYAIGVAGRAIRAGALRASVVVSSLVLLVLAGQLLLGGLTAARAALVGNSGQLGGYLVLLAGLCLATFRGDVDPRWRRIGGAVGAGCLAAVVLTGSYAATIASLVLLAWLAWEVRASAPRVLTAAVVGGVALLGIALVWSEQFRALGPSVRGRVDTWVVSLTVIAERPVLGWGLEGFRHGFASHAPPSFVATWGDSRIQDRAHSLPLDHVAATGILGGAALALLFIAILRAIDRDDRTDRALLATLGAMGVFLLGWFPEADLAAVALAVAGLATAPARGEGAVGPARVLTVTTAGAALLVVTVGSYALVEDQRFHAELVAAVGAPAAEPVTAGASGAGPPAPLRRAFGRSSGYTEQLAAVGFAVGGSAEQLAGDLAVLGAASPWQRPERDAEVAYVRARLLDALAAHRRDAASAARAERAYLAVIDLAPHHTSAWQGLAQVQLRRGDAQGLESLAVLADLRPRDVGPRFDLVAVHLRRGDLRSAERWLADACRIAPDDPQLALLVEQARGVGVSAGGCA